MLTSGRRELALAVLLGAAGAAVALVSLRQTWLVEVTARPEPFPAERTAYTGGDLRPWLPALAWVALAGAGALIATRATARRLVGGVMVLTGGGIGIGAAVAAPDAEVSAGWALLTAAGGLAAAGAGGLALARGRGWPGLGARYQRTPRRPSSEETPEALWEALDRGEDPTTR